MLNRFLSGDGGGPRIGKASQIQKQKMRDKKSAGLSKYGSNDYKSGMKERMRQQERDRLLTGSRSSGFSMVGGKEVDGPQRSKAYQEAIEMMLAKKEAKEKKKERKKLAAVEIKARYIGQGRVDGRGNIFDASGRFILTIDKKTGKIKNRMGSTVGKYDPTSNNSLFVVSRLIDQYGAAKNNFWGTAGANSPFGNSVWGGGGSNNNNIWGNSSGSSGGNVWGSGSSGGGNVWGSNNDDGGGWW